MKNYKTGSLMFAFLWFVLVSYACNDNITDPDDGNNDSQWIKEGLIIPPGPTESGYYALSDPFVLRDGDKWRAYFAAGDRAFTHGRIYMATSSDGSIWEIYPQAILDVGAGDVWDKTKAEVPCLIRDSEKYRLWYGGMNKDVLPDVEFWGIGYAESSDGVNFSKLDSSASPYGESGLVLLPDESVPGHQLAIADPSVVWDGSMYLLWFTGFDMAADEWVISMATSSDGINWRRIAGAVLRGTESWEQWQGFSMTVEPDVLLIDGRFLMVYAVFDEPESSAIKAFGYAESSDGRTWEKSPDPILVSDPEFLFTGPNLVQDGEDLLLYYSGADPNSERMAIYRARKAKFPKTNPKSVQGLTDKSQ